MINTSLFDPPSQMVTGGQDFATCQPELTPPYARAQHAPRPPVATPGVTNTGQVTHELGSSRSVAI
jgi:hypothetical protein